MSKDISSILSKWPVDEASCAARVITSATGQPLIQLRLDCGLLQMHLDGRPDGEQPHGYKTFLQYIQEQLTTSGETDEDTDSTTASPRRIWAELDREMSQFYHRRQALLEIARHSQNEGKPDLARNYYERAAQDADYTLGAMDFVCEYCDDEDYVGTHEQSRPFVLWHRTTAVAQLQVIGQDFDEAIEQIKCGIAEITKVYEDNGLDKWLDHDQSIAELKELERHIRRRYGVKTTLNEQLSQALAKEDYESAVKIRDQLKARGRFPSPRRPAVSDSSRF